jgi:mannosyltransferase OCH1-like enzyme
MIPKVMHFIWIGPAMPDWAKDNIAIFRTVNPDWKVEIHSKEVLLPCFRPAYDAIHGEHEYARKSDLLRVSVLMRAGGWYLDTDFLPVRPLQGLYQDYQDFPRDCFITHCAMVTGTQRKWYGNGIIATTPHSPFLSMMVRGIIERQAKGLTGWDTFGPGLVTPLVEQWPDLIHIGQIDDFYRIQERKESMAAYKRIREAGYSPAVIIREIGEPLPYLFHQSMQDETEL